MKKVLIALSLLVTTAVNAEPKAGFGNWAKRMEEENRIFWQNFEKGAVQSFDAVTAQIEKDAKIHGWTVKHIFSIKLDRERNDLTAPLQYAAAFFTDAGDVVRIRYLAKDLKMLKYDVKLKSEVPAIPAPTTTVEAKKPA